MDATPRITALIPCRNERTAVEAVLLELEATLAVFAPDHEIIIVDNGSADGSIEAIIDIAKSIPSLRLVHEPHIGYGSAYKRGIAEAKGKVTIMLDCDGTYDPKDIAALIAPIESGEADIVIGNRFGGRMEDGAMPWTHKYVGNPILSRLARFGLGVSVPDVHCGIRAARTDALKSLGLTSEGMEFATEMLARSSAARLRHRSVSVAYRARIGVSKLRPIQDALRHIMLMLVLTLSRRYTSAL